MQFTGLFGKDSESGKDRLPGPGLLLVTDQCSMYCRHCTRRRMAGATDQPMPRARLERAFTYIQNNRQIRDVVVSGGDPLTLSDEHLEYILQRLRAIRHLEIIRIGTRTPIAHFRTPVARGIEIIESLRGHTSGLAVPTFVVDAPGGGGKIPVNPQYLISQSTDRVVLRNFEGKLFVYREPSDRLSECTCQDCRDQTRLGRIGIAGMLGKRVAPMVSTPPREKPPRVPSI